jgi:hypothetical protein
MNALGGFVLSDLTLEFVFLALTLRGARSRRGV